MPVVAWIALGGLFVTVSLQAAAFSYFQGRMAERVAVLEREAKREAGLSEKVTRLEVHVENLGTKLESLDRSVQGLNRQLANLAMGKGGLFTHDTFAGE